MFFLMSCQSSCGGACWRITWATLGCSPPSAFAPLPPPRPACTRHRMSNFIASRRALDWLAAARPGPACSTVLGCHPPRADPTARRRRGELCRRSSASKANEARSRPHGHVSRDGAHREWLRPSGQAKPWRLKAPSRAHVAASGFRRRSIRRTSARMYAKARVGEATARRGPVRPRAPPSGLRASHAAPRAVHGAAPQHKTRVTAQAST